MEKINKILGKYGVLTLVILSFLTFIDTCGTKGKIQQTNKRIDQLEKTIREELLSKLTENHKAIAKDLDVKKLKTYVELNTVSHNYDTTRTGGLTFNTEGKNWSDFTSKELIEIEKKNPDLHKKLYNNYLKTKK